MSISRPNRVLVTTDLTSGSLLALPYAIALARRHGARVDVVHVVIEYTDVGVPFPEGPVLDTHVERLAEEAERALEELEVGETDGVEVRRHVVRSGSAAMGVVDTAGSVDADVIVIASHGRRLFSQIVLGSVARNVMATAPCPVLCVKSDEHGMLDPETGALRLRRLLVATDFSEASARALEIARSLAAVHDGEVEVLHVAHVDIPPGYLGAGVQSIFELDPDIETRLMERLRRFVAVHHAGPPRVTMRIAEGSVSRAISSRADDMDADVIVLSRNGRDETPHLLGGVPERLLHDAHCPILLV